MRNGGSAWLDAVLYDDERRESDALIDVDALGSGSVTSSSVRSPARDVVAGPA